MKEILSKQYINIVRFLEILAALFLLPLLYNYVPIDKKAAETFYIDATNRESIVDTLEKNGYTVTLIDKMMMQVDKLPESAWYTLKKENHGRFTFFKNIYKQKATTMDVVIYAGETHSELIKRLSNDLKLTKDKLFETYKIHSRFKEADIFSGHYQIARKAKEGSVMLYLFDTSHKILDLFIEKNFREKPDHFELKVLLTIASIIQKESNAVEEMPLISSVIYNRLRKNMKLQMDGTLNYGPYSHTIVTPERIKNDTTYFNTYKYRGLPPYPLGTISIDALHAAMFPAKNDHLFFMLKPNGKHHFSTTYEEHLETIRIFRKYQKQKEEKKAEKAALLAKQCLIENNNTKETNSSNKKP